MDMFTSYGHIEHVKRQNKNTDFLIILMLHRGGTKIHKSSPTSKVLRGTSECSIDGYICQGTTKGKRRLP